MRLDATLKKLEQTKQQFVHTVRRLGKQSHRQRLDIVNSDPNEIRDYTAQKKQLLQQYTVLLSHLQDGIRQVARDGDSDDKRRLEAITKALDSECKPVIEEIIRQERLDQDFLAQAKDVISGEIKKIRDARDTIKKMKSGYAVRKHHHEPQVFDGQG